MKKTIYICDLCGRQMMIPYLQISIEAEEGETEERDLCEACTMRIRKPEKDAEPHEEKPKKARKAPKREPVDRGKVMALAQAKWPVTKIADEMGCSAQTIYNIINAEARKEADHEA